MKALALHATERALTRFMLRISKRSAFLFGLLLGGLPAMQGLAYVATYPSAAERAQFVHTLAANPAIGILYGNPQDALLPEGYIVYRCLAVLLLAASLWGLLSATKLFRGQEEDGRWELVLTGQITPGLALTRATLGWLAASLIGLIVGGGAIAALGLSPSLAIPVTSGFFYALVVMTMAVLFFAVGMLTSQLAATRRRATLYGLVPLLTLYVLRCIENVSDNLSWLRSFNPFCWLENARPIVDSQPLWLLPILGLAVVCGAAAVIIARHRDLGDSIIAGPDVVQPRYALLRGVFPSAIRLGWPVLAAWAAACIGITAIIAAITKTAVEAVADSPSLRDAVSSLAGGSSGIASSFLSMTTFFAAAVLVAMAAGGIGAMRKDEARSYVDNILVRPISRVRWLGARMALIVGVLCATLAVSTVAVGIIATISDIHVDGARYFFETFNVMGPILFIVGLGVLCYGWRPRLAAPVVYGALLWSFILDLVGSTVTLNHALANTSFFRHLALTPAVHPQWGISIIAMAGGVILAAIGFYLFTRRDLEIE